LGIEAARSEVATQPIEAERTKKEERRSAWRGAFFFGQEEAGGHNIEGTRGGDTEEQVDVREDFRSAGAGAQRMLFFLPLPAALHTAPPPGSALLKERRAEPNRIRSNKQLDYMP
jgi:hypothetical protein